MDPILRRFVDAADEAEAARELDDLIAQQALPLARAIVARKLSSYGGGGGHPDVQDRDDVIGEAMVVLIERLHRMRQTPDEGAIEQFENYAAAVIHSACAHHIRRRHPERARLKDRLRYVFSTDRRLALWSTNQTLVCGLSEWRGRAPEPDAGQALKRSADRDEQQWASLDRSGLARAVIELAFASGGPTEFEAFVAAAAAHIAEPKEVVEVVPSPSREPPQDLVIEHRHFLEHVWAEIRALPVRQRIALLLNLRDANGAGILWLLPIAGIASIRQIARVLEIEESEFARLWLEMPLDDTAIGGRLGCTRQQVINLRLSARKRLFNRVEQLLTSAFDRQQGRANLAPVSASLKGSV